MKINKLFLSFVCFVFFIAGAAVITSSAARAAEISWSSSADPGISVKDADPASAGMPNGCQEEEVFVAGRESKFPSCVHQGLTVKIGTAPNYGEGIVAFPGDSKFYRFGASGLFGSRGTVLMPGTDTVHSTGRIDLERGNMRIYKNFSKKFDRRISISRYEFNWSRADFELKDELGNWVPTKAAGHSQNGKWVAVELLNKGIALIDVENNSAKIISRSLIGQTNLSETEFAVSNDGQHVILTSRTTTVVLIDVNNNCGDAVTATNLSYTLMERPCSERNLSGLLEKNVRSVYRGGLHNPIFSSDSGQIKFYYSGGENNFKEIVLTANGYTPPPQLDYLALGDSYSSGEGDTQVNPVTNTKYYRGYTDNTEDLTHGVPREKCHLSTRSYPYKLSLAMNLGVPRVIGANAGKWQTVACSGAMVFDANLNRTENYLGQPRDDLPIPRLQGFLNANQLKLSALNEFIPGREKQIKFAEKYKPKAITLTMGGNDAMFAEVMKACVDPRVDALSTCSYAGSNDKKSNLGYAIKRQYGPLKSLYKDLIAKSGGTKLYVLGYPQFANSAAANSLCLPNVRLNNEERVMVRESIYYMNSVIKAAAQASGAIYVNIEQALNSYKLCDIGEKAVTGITFLPPNDIQESFHPNNKGHQLIAAKFSQAVNNESLVTYTCSTSTLVACPDDQVTEPATADYFAVAMQNNTPAVNTRLMIPRVMQTIQDVKITTDDLVLLANSIVNIVLFSDPKNLGTFTVDSNGRLSAEIDIPANTPAGYHTVEVTGKTYSGEPIKLWQIIEVQGSNPNDRDDDGIIDTEDKCLYAQAANIDADFDGIDDACDPDISQSPQLYRVRSGISANGEQPSHLYVERNVRASSVTGITGDYDPNNDGWAIVGASQDATDASISANFWVDANKKPHFSIRTEENGCVQYTPTSLARVESAGTRNFTREATNTATCRSEPHSSDTDINGVGDDVQRLYKARNGVASQGEDETKLYLERTTRTAEVHVKVSDYAPIDTTLKTMNNDNRQVWSLLASSQNSTTKGIYKKLLVTNHQPIILALNASNQCIALKPTSLGVIKKSTQTTKGLEQTTIPAGESCE